MMQKQTSSTNTTNPNVPDPIKKIKTLTKEDKGTNPGRTKNLTREGSDYSERS